MIVFKCKMCGGEMELEQGATVAECPYCLTKQTLPKLDNDKRANMYDRANHFRRQNEYDKAMAIFENILQEDRTDAEAYWSLVLCRYGIEYVEDPATHKRVPTVNRVQYASILADEDYKSALEYSDFAQRSVYESEAKTIDEIQKGILAISKQEKPFDVFICYKETDANGRRTPDSVLANDLYHQLTNEGFKVFFSRITLEDKIGTAYEPYIFAALNSAKVMVVIGTKPEYFNAVWVKNEWSRYLALIRAGAEKTLVPAYRDMDPYDLPDEFSHLQAQDMGKLGFMQDLIRGIKKLTAEDTPNVQTVTQQNGGGGSNIENLMKRVHLFLEDGNFSSADEYLERVLDENAEYAPAYIGKLLVELKLNREGELSQCLSEYEKNANWQKALRFADIEFRQELEGYSLSSRKTREENEREQQTRITIEKRLRDTKNMFAALYGIGIIINAFGETFAFPLKPENFIDEDLLSEVNRTKNVSSFVGANIALPDRGNCLSCIIFRRNDGTIQIIRSKYTCSTDMFYPAFPRAGQWKNISEAILSLQHLIALTDYGELVSSYAFKDEVYPSFIKDGADRNDKRHDEYTLGNITKKISIKQLSSRKKVAQIHAHLNGLAGFDVIYEDGTVWGDFDGTVIDSQSMDFKLWKDLKQIESRLNGVVGLRKDGTVIALGNNEYGQCDIADWHSIASIAVSRYVTFGLTEDGKVITTGKFYYERNNYGIIFDIDVKHDCENWSDIIHVSCSYDHVVGLKKDGTVVAAGYNQFGQCDVSSWKNVVNVFAKDNFTIGILDDGHIVYTRGLLPDDSEKSKEILKRIQEIRLFDHVDSIDEENKARKKTEQARIEAERAEQQKREAEKREAQRRQREEEEARKQLEKAKKQEEENKNKIEALKKEKSSLQIELADLKGLFSKKRRREIEEKLMKINSALEDLKHKN